jgi:predicted TIM-barrel fold metal-dependent hydrolase
MAHRIDVHHHPSAPAHLGKKNAAGDDGNQPQWRLEKALEMMDEGGVATAILSLPHPADAWSGDAAEAAARARGWNEHMGTLAHDNPGRFGVFATLPILDIDASLREAAHALDTLKADGILLMTNIGERWLGDPHYWPLFEELNRRKAVVYTHPVAPLCCHNIFPGLNDATIEFATDTTRAIARLLFSGAATRFPDIRFIFSHGGGTMPFIVERFVRAIEFGPGRSLKPLLPNGVLAELGKLYYDTAQAAHRGAISSLRELVPATQLLFGTDYPYRTAEETTRGLNECGFSDAEMEAIDCLNARQLLPRWTR